jgi:hypothetical protein
MGAVKAGQILDLDDLELARELVNSAELPILTISKDPFSSRADRFTPGVSIYLDRFEFLESLPNGIKFQVLPLETACSDIESCKSILKAFRVMSAPTPARISECDAVEYVATFVFEHKNLQPTPVRMRTLAIFQMPATYTLRMFDSPYSGRDLVFDYTSFIESVRMV